MKKYRLLALLLAMALLAGILLPGCTPEPTEPKEKSVDFTFYGVWMEEGQLQDEFSFSLQGILPLEFEHQSSVDLELNFIWPESSGYRNEGMQIYIGGGAEYAADNAQPIYHGAGFIYNPGQAKSYIMTYTLFLAEEYMVIGVGSRYLLASTDPNADPTAIFERYQQYVQ